MPTRRKRTAKLIGRLLTQDQLGRKLAKRAKVSSKKRSVSKKVSKTKSVTKSRKTSKAKVTKKRDIKAHSKSKSKKGGLSS